MRNLLRQKQSRPLILIWLTKIPLQKQRFFRLIANKHVRNHRQIGITIVQKSCFPIHQPHAASVEKDIVGLEEIVMARNHVCAMRIHRCDLRISRKQLIALRCWKNIRRLKPSQEFIERSSFIQKKRV